MNNHQSNIRATEMVASPLEYHQPQRHKTETFTRARELRRWIAEHPDCARTEMPEQLRGYLTFLERKKLVTWKRRSDGAEGWRVKPQ